MTPKELIKLFAKIQDKSNYEISVNGKIKTVSGKRLKAFIITQKNTTFKEIVSKNTDEQPSKVLSHEKITNNE